MIGDNYWLPNIPNSLLSKPGNCGRIYKNLGQSSLCKQGGRGTGGRGGGGTERWGRQRQKGGGMKQKMKKSQLNLTNQAAWWSMMSWQKSKRQLVISGSHRPEYSHRLNNSSVTVQHVYSPMNLHYSSSIYSNFMTTDTYFSSSLIQSPECKLSLFFFINIHEDS